MPSVSQSFEKHGPSRKDLAIMLAKVTVLVTRQGVELKHAQEQLAVHEARWGSGWRSRLRWLVKGV